MKQVFKKGLAVVLSAAMVLAFAPGGNADAAKKPSIAKKASVKVGATVKIKVKNANKKAKVKWKSSNKKVATAKGNAKAVKVKGVSAGKAKISATYKVGKKSYKLKSTVTVKADDGGKTPDAAPAGSEAPKGSEAPVGTTVPGGKATATPKVTPTKGPTATPRPSPTPTNAPKNAGPLLAYGKSASKTITADGTANAEEWEDTVENNLLTNEYSVRGTTSVTAATAKMYWAAGEFYALVTVTKANAGANDSVVLYFDQDSSATGDYDTNKNAIAVKVPANGAGSATKNANAYTVTAAGKTTSTGYTVEIKLAGITANLAAGGTVRADIQINDGDATINYYDSRSKMEYDKEANKWNLGDEKVTVDANTALYGPISLINAMADPLVALQTTQGAAMISAAALPDAFESETYKSKAMTFVPTTYWTDVYAAAGQPAIEFANFNIPDYLGDASRVTLTTADVKGYTIWDKDYIYVLYDVTDPDIAPSTADGYDTDSVEFFLDEDNSREATYGDNKDAIQVRINAIDNLFTANENGTASYPLVAHATQIKSDGTGYFAEFIIKLTKEHKVGDMMGMDLQINDCYTTDEGGATRAGTVTAYDTTNNGYQDPSVFGRIKLK